METTPSTEEKPKINNPPKDTPKEKSNKGLKTALIICVVLTLAGIGFGIYGFFFKKPSQSEALNSLDLDTISVVSDPKELPAAQSSEEPQEVTVTNPYIVRDLNHKLSIMHGINHADFATESSKYINTVLAYNNVSNLYDGKGLSDDNKAAIVVSAEQFNSGSSLDYTVAETIIANINEFRSQNNLPLMTQDELRSSYYIPYAKANQSYFDTFGDTLSKGNINGGCTRSYKYIASADVFIDAITYAGVGGCGGAGFPGFAIRKGDYKAKGSEIYIDVSALTSLVNENNCDVYSGYPDIVQENEAPKFSQEKIDSYVNNSFYCGFSEEYLASHDSLFDNATSYRFTFKKNSEGIYAFSEVEKL